MNYLSIRPRGNIDQPTKTFLGLFGNCQAELVQSERVVLLVEHSVRERGLIPVRVRVHRVDIPAHADPRRLENLVERRNRGGFGLGERRGRSCKHRRNGRSEKKFFHCLTFRWVSRPSPFSMARARFFISFYQWVGPLDAVLWKSSGTKMMRNQIVTHWSCAVGRNGGETLDSPC